MKNMFKELVHSCQSNSYYEVKIYSKNGNLIASGTGKSEEEAERNAALALKKSQLKSQL